MGEFGELEQGEELCGEFESVERVQAKSITYYLKNMNDKIFLYLSIDECRGNLHFGALMLHQ